MNIGFTLAWSHGAMSIKACVMPEESMPETKMVMGSVKSMSTQWKVFGPYFVPGYDHTEEFLKQNCRYIWAFFNSYTILASEVRLYSQPCLSVCFVRSPWNGVGA
jgi:hypothetical protein